MKLRVSIPGAYMAMDLEDAAALRVFRKTMELMLAAGAAHLEEDASGPVKIDQDPEPVEAELDSEPAELIEPEEEPEKAEEEITLEEPAAAPEKIAPPKASRQYSGFLYIKCPDCEYSRGFFTKIGTDEYRCGCGTVTKLRDLVPLFINCECGKNIRYMTNMTENAFDIDCIGCGAPVAVQWNEKKELYETIQ